MLCSWLTECGGACAQAPTADVHAAVNLTERARGTVSPASLTFLASNWAQPQARNAPVYQLVSLREIIF